MEKLFAVMEHAGSWRFVGPAFKLPKEAQDYAAARFAAHHLHETKIVKIFRRVSA